MNVGMKGILVKTGKYIENIESTAVNPPTKVIDSFADAVDWLLQHKLTIWWQTQYEIDRSTHVHVSDGCYFSCETERSEDNTTEERKKKTTIYSE